jgi:hypothetical protein
MDPYARRLAALFTVGLIAFYSPILGAFNRPASWFGIPLLPLYIFLAWMGLIGVAWILVRGGRR